MDEIKKKLSRTVNDYRRLFADEYEAFKKQFSQQKLLLRDQRYASTDDGLEHTVERALIEWPETLYTMVVNTLSEEEMVAFKDGKKLMRWFAQNYPEFRVPEKV